MITVVVADEHPIIRAGLKTELHNCLDIEVIGEASNGDEALKTTLELRPDILLLGTNMAGINPDQIINEFSSNQPLSRVLIYTSRNEPEYALKLLNAGARGYLLQHEHPLCLVHAIKAAVAGSICLSPDITKALLSFVAQPNKAQKGSLSEREATVLKLLAQGYTNVDIAETLCITVGTVKNHISNIYDKLGVNSRSEATAWAWQNGLLENLVATTIADSSP